jgi:RNA polymerase sigma-70 factor (ECF subfamily)
MLHMSGTNDCEWDAPSEDDRRPLADARVRACLERHYAFVWRMLRRIGVPEHAVADAAQNVFLVFARRAEDVELSAERAFLLGSARRVASEYRRSERKHLGAVPLDAAVAVASADPLPDDLTEHKRARECFDQVLDAMSMDLRVVFVLFELESLSTPQIAELLDIPVGTASSRLRRAREQFQTLAAKLWRRRSGSRP